MVRLAVVLLAAGAGSRYVGPTHKLLAPLGTSTVVGQAAAHALAADVGPVLVVEGAVALPRLPGCVVVRHAGWTDGQASSLRAGLAAAGEVDAVVVGLADQPGVSPATWNAVASAPGGPVVAARRGVHRGPPVRLDRAVWPLLPHSGDEGARVVMREHPHLVSEVAIDDDLADIDTVEDLERWS